MPGIIYILTNPSMPGIVKIGKTNLQGLQERMSRLYNTSVALPFHCFYACEVENQDLVEKKLHDAFDDHRVNQSREFFEIDPDRVKSALELAALSDVTPITEEFETPEDEKAVKKAFKGDAFDVLELFKTKLSNASELHLPSDYHHVMEDVINEMEIGFGKIGQPLRVALLGKMSGPGLDSVMAIIGAQETISRISNAITKNS